MRESVFFELRLRRFGVWRLAVWSVAGAAILAMAAWAAGMWDSQAQFGRALVAAVAGGLVLGTIAVASSVARAPAGTLTCAAGAWSYASDAGLRCSGKLEVAMDLGAFLLLRLVDERQRSAWLPVQRRGLEAQWHGFRCAVYSPPPLGAAASTALPPPSE
jgi:hypothetical protein